MVGVIVLLMRLICFVQASNRGNLQVFDTCGHGFAFVGNNNPCREY